MDVELLEVFDDEADQGYYQDENLTPEELEQLVRQTGQFSTGSFEKLPGQMAAPMNNGVPTPPSKTDGLPGELGLELSWLRAITIDIIPFATFFSNGCLRQYW